MMFSFMWCSIHNCLSINCIGKNQLGGNIYAKDQKHGNRESSNSALISPIIFSIKYLKKPQASIKYSNIS